MALPSYLVRRDGGRYHVQMRFGKALACELDSIHLRLSLRTSDQRVARRRLVEMLDWAIEFRDAPDLEAAGAVIVRKLERFIADGPPQDGELQGRLVFETYIGDFIRRSRERDFPWVAKLPALIHFFKIFTEQNAAAESSGDKLERKIVKGHFHHAVEVDPLTSKNVIALEVQQKAPPVSNRRQRLGWKRSYKIRQTDSNHSKNLS